jgi:hypothetical protein
VSVNSGGQDSNFFEANIDYTRPIVIKYSGPGKSNANTEGDEYVYIAGENFGAKGAAKLDSVTYGKEGTEYTAKDCSVTSNDREIKCKTVPGAGTELKWIVTVDGQTSTLPTTSYGSPVVLGVEYPIESGKNEKINPDGGEWFAIKGSNFGPQKPDSVSSEQWKSYIDSVSYGPTGREYTATDCTTVESSVKIICKTVPGSGSGHKVVVKIAKQISAESAPLITYAVPLIISSEPKNGTTAGGYEMVVKGRYFSISGKSSSVQILLDGKALAAVSSRDEINSLDVLTASVPEGFGQYKPVSVQVTSNHNNELTKSSNSMDFSYDAPIITGVYTEEPSASEYSTYGEKYGWNFLKLSILGNNFCGSISCAAVLGKITDVDTVFVNKDVFSIDHQRIVVFIEGKRGSVFVQVGLRKTSTRDFITLPPKILDQVQAELDNTKHSTVGGSQIELTGRFFGNTPKVTIGGTLSSSVVINHQDQPCPASSMYAGSDDCTIITATVPAGQGLRQTVVVLNGDQESLPLYLDYEVPSIASVDGKADLNEYEVTGATAGATTITIIGTNLGTGTAGKCVAYLGKDKFPMTTQSWTHDKVVVVTQSSPGGKKLDLILNVGGQIPSNANVTFTFTAPTVLSISPNKSATTGNIQVEIKGQNFGYYKGANKYLIVRIGTDTNEPCTVVSYDHTSILCMIPPGQGAQQSVYVVANGQSNSDLNAKVDPFSYDPPALLTTSLSKCDTSGGCIMTLTGSNFGASADKVSVEFESDSNAFKSLTAGDKQLVTVPRDNILFFNHTYIRLQVPPGQGPNKYIVVNSAGQKKWQSFCAYVQL